MDKSKHRRWPFRVGKKGHALSLLSLPVALLAILFTVNQIQLLQKKTAPSSPSNAIFISSQSMGQSYLLQPHKTGSSSNVVNGTNTSGNVVNGTSTSGNVVIGKGITGPIDVSADFGSRQNQAYPIPYQFLGVGGIGMGTAVNNDGSAIPQANFRLAKVGDYDYMSLIFPSAASLTNPSQQSWTKFDAEMANVVAYDLQPIITLGYTPSWLQPQNQNPPQHNPCLTNSPPAQATRIKPMYLVNGQDQGPQTWGQLAALMVAHVDHNFPQVHAMYEIWNEPDQAQFMCVPDGDPNAQQDRLAQYKAIFAAAAPQMRQQASRDGTSIEIGGPALAYALQQQLSIWFPGLLDDPTIYPYIDFVTYQRYLYGTSFSGGSTSLISNAQDPVLGITAEYEQVARAVHAGKQSNAATTPIYLDEYNMNSCVPNICRNDPTLAPLNNALFLADVLNTVNDTSTSFGHASSVPAGLAFYTWNIPGGNICMFGVIDAQMDCSTNGTIVPYPQYYTYELFGGSNYLNITNGGYVANTVSSSHSGIFVTGFYTSTNDCIVIVNTTSTTYTGMNVMAQNAGHSSSSSATMFTLQYAQHPSSPIVSQPVSLYAGSTGYEAAVPVPAYTTVALTFTAS